MNEKNVKKGYIKLYNSFLDWEWYGNTNTKIVFLHLLLLCNHQDFNVQGVTIKRGECCVTQEKLATAVSLSIQQLRTTLINLKSTGEITVTKHPKFSVISIKNYSQYQSGNSSFNSKSTVNQQQSQQQNNSQSTALIRIKEDNKESTTAVAVVPKKDDDDGDEEENRLYASKKYPYVMLSEKQTGKLLEELSLDEYDFYINRLNEWLSRGNRARNHYATIRKWAKQDRQT